MQAFCRIDHPSRVSCCQRDPSIGSNMQRSDFGRLDGIEIAVRIKSDVPVTGAPCTAEMIEPHIGGVCAAIELVDDSKTRTMPSSMFARLLRTIRERRHCPVRICDEMA